MIAGVFDYIDLNQISRLLQQIFALLAEVAQVQYLAGVQITLGEGVDGLDG